MLATRVFPVALAALVTLGVSGDAAYGQQRPDIHHAVLNESGRQTPEISTAELERILKNRSAIVFDARPFREFAVSNIPGARSLSAKQGVSISLYARTWRRSDG